MGAETGSQDSMQRPSVQGHPQPYPTFPSHVPQQAYVHSPTEPLSNVPTGKWTTGICDCFSDCETCCCTCWCPCIQVGRNLEIISEGRTECVTGGILWYIVEAFTGCGCIYTFSYRKLLRHKYTLQEQPCNDFCTHCCCGACAICQEGRELKNRGWDLSLGYAGNMQAFQATHGVPIQQAMQK